MSSKKMIILQSSDGETFEMEEKAARKLQIVAHMIEDNCVDEAIPLANVTGKILARVIEYCNKHVNDDDDDDVSAQGDDASKEAKEKALKDFDERFMKEFDMDMKFQLIVAANYLNIKDLLDLLSQTIADCIKDNTVDEIRSIFNIENDFTPEEEDAIRKDNHWAFQ